MNFCLMIIEMFCCQILEYFYLSNRFSVQGAWNLQEIVTTIESSCNDNFNLAIWLLHYVFHAFPGGVYPRRIVFKVNF